ncbi:hypothetical protein PS631_01713 [Pseudomonas fluorescens]|uniref:Uncharacterized protein n=1 Tax=Pseudomonas fluorescens TaxID=294 RepID=A0A5E6RLZ0_PSEFL|nr:HAD domain-containing protein [Pseudomonas fluorescens]VVM69171.1 hypothetical protein PS631_01713 [Pseudomonas fluorescens]
MNDSIRPRTLRPHHAILFLDFDGVLHADAAFRTKHGIELRAPGALMMYAGILQEILQDFPRVQISLSTSWVRLLGYKRARAALPRGLQVRTISATYHSRMRDTAREGYDLFTRYEQICGAATRSGISKWIALDDDPEFSWPLSDDRLVRCDPDIGLGSESTQAELRSKLRLLDPR